MHDKLVEDLEEQLKPAKADMAAPFEDMEFCQLLMARLNEPLEVTPGPQGQRPPSADVVERVPAPEVDVVAPAGELDAPRSPPDLMLRSAAASQALDVPHGPARPESPESAEWLTPGSPDDGMDAVAWLLVDIAGELTAGEAEERPAAEAMEKLNISGELILPQGDEASPPDVSPASDDLPVPLRPPLQPTEPILESPLEVAPESFGGGPACRTPKRQESRSLSCGASTQEAVRASFWCGELEKETMLRSERPTIRFRDFKEVMAERRRRTLEAREVVA